MQFSNDVNFVGARKGATGTLDDLKSSPPVPKAWLNPSLVNSLMVRLEADQHKHSRINLHSILHSQFFDKSKERYRIVWSKNMITSGGVSKIQRKDAKLEYVLHLRDGEEERGDNQRWMRQILERLFAKDGRARQSVEDFLYLTLVHEASEIQQRKQVETLLPVLKAEVRAEIEEAKAYFSLPEDRRRMLRRLYEMLDETYGRRKNIYSVELDLFESIGEENLGSIEGLLALIEFVLEMPDYAKEATFYPDERTRLQLARSLFVDVLHDFAGSSKADKWVRTIESADEFPHPVTFNYTENSEELSKQAEELLGSAARVIQALKPEEAEPDYLPSKNTKKRVIESFNNKIAKLDSIKAQLALNEVLSIPAELKAALEDNNLNRHFSFMDKFGIYHSLNLSRLDLRGLKLHSGEDRRSENDHAREINKHKDMRADLRGVHMVGSDISQAADFSAAQLDFAIAAYSNLSEVVFTRTKAIGMIFYGANANEAQFERARMTAVDARGMSASFARIQTKETDINGMKIWQSDVPSWQRAYVDIFQVESTGKDDGAGVADRETLKAELDFLDDSFLDELDVIEQTDTFQTEQTWIELREVDGQFEFLKGRGIVFYSREETLEYSVSE